MSKDVIIAIIGAAAIIIAAIITGIFSRKSRDNQGPTPIPRVIINSPASSDKVGQRIEVRGTASNIPQDKELWLIVQEKGLPSYSPQEGGPIQISPTDGTWSAPARIGQDNPNDIGKWYVLYATLVDKNNTKAQDALSAYFTQGRQGNWVPFTSLPNGIQPVRQVDVVRTS